VSDKIGMLYEQISIRLWMLSAIS